MLDPAGRAQPLKIPVADLKVAVGQQERVVADEPVDDLPVPDGTARMVGPVRVEADVIHSDGEFVADVRAKGTAEAACARCLEPVRLPLDVRFREIFRQGAAAPGERERDQEEDEITYFQGDFIDLTPSVAENLALGIPMKTLCRADCRGLCPTCGKNLNEGHCQCPVPIGDPRLAVLRDLIRPESDDGGHR